MQKQIHVYYSGRVQGVGFRFTTEAIARKLSVCGWVKNLADGRVEVVAQAEEESLKEFLSSINQYFSRYIEDADIQWQEPLHTLRDFRIRF